MKTKQQVLEWFSERVAISKDAAETIIKILKTWGIYDVYVRYMSQGAKVRITVDEFCDWFHGGLESENNAQSNGELLPVLGGGSLVTEIAELQRQIDDRDRLLEHIFFVLKGDVTRRIIRTDIPLASRIVDLLVGIMANKTRNDKQTKII